MPWKIIKHHPLVQFSPARGVRICGMINAPLLPSFSVLGKITSNYLYHVFIMH